MKIWPLKPPQDMGKINQGQAAIGLGLYCGLFTLQSFFPSAESDSTRVPQQQIKFMITDMHIS